MARGSFVYVIEQSGSGFLKVGLADDPARRLHGLQGASPVALELAHSARCASREIAAQVEYRAHTILAQHRARGEWFSCDASAAIAAVDAARKYVRNRRGELAYERSLKRSVNLGIEVSANG